MLDGRCRARRLSTVIGHPARCERYGTLVANWNGHSRTRLDRLKPASDHFLIRLFARSPLKVQFCNYRYQVQNQVASRGTGDSHDRRSQSRS